MTNIRDSQRPSVAVPGTKRIIVPINTTGAD